jgi:hypothetical protein
MPIINVRKSVTIFVLRRPKLLRAYLKLRTPSSTVYQSLTNGMDADATSVRKRLGIRGLTRDYSDPYKDNRNG